MTNQQGRKILIAEDEVSMRQILAEKFAREGFVVIEALDGEEGISKALEETPDIILLDLMMPKVDGISMLKKIRAANAWGKKVPAIILTNLVANDNIISSVTETEPSYYLVKSDWRIDDIVQKVKERLDETPA